MISTENDSGTAEDFDRAVGSTWLGLPESRREEAVKQFEKSLVAEKVVDVDWGNPKDLTKPYRMTVTGQGYRNSGGSEQSVYAFIPQAAAGSPRPLAELLVAANQDESAPNKRTEDYDVLRGFTSEQRWIVVPPAGFKLKNLPDVKDTTLGPIKFERKATIELDGSVLFVYRLATARHQFSVADARQITDALKQPALRNSYRVEFMPEGTELMSEGKWKEGIALLRRDAASDPPRPSALLRYAAALLEAGMRDEAAKACRKAIEVDSKSARAWAYLSWVERHDAMGRVNQPGMNLAGAEKAIQKAVELDPTNKRYVVDRALVKEVDESGARYQDPERLAEAIGLLEGIAADLPAIQQPNVLPEALLYARRFAELKSFYEKDESRGARVDFRFAAIAEADGASAAIRESRTLQPDEAGRKVALTNAAHDLELIGDYSKAAELLEASGSTASGIELFRHAGRHGEVPRSKDPVIAVVQQYIFALCDRRVSPKHDELLAPESKTLSWIDQRTQLVGFLAGYRNIAGNALGTRSIADIVVGNVEFVKDGSDAMGYRIRFADPSASGAMKTLGWVVRRGDAYKILGLRNDGTAAAALVLALAQKGDLESAGKWLDWMRDENSSALRDDPLATLPYVRLWPAADRSQKDQVMRAAAALATRGHEPAEAVGILKTQRESVTPEALRHAVDQAIVNGFANQRKYAEELPLATELLKAYPTSATALGILGTAYVYAGRFDRRLESGRLREARKRRATVGADPSLRRRARVSP